MVNTTQVSVPESVEILYRMVGATHVFSSNGIKGVLQVGNYDQEQAFNAVIPALNKHISYAYNCEAAYKLSTTYVDFVAHLEDKMLLDSNFLTVVLDSQSELCH